MASTKYGLKILHHCVKEVKTKSQKVLGAISYIEVTKEKLVKEPFCPLAILSSVKTVKNTQFNMEKHK